MKEGLLQVFQCKSEDVEEVLKKWLSRACRCRIPSFVELSVKKRRHREAIIATVHHGLSNARIVSMNNKIKVMIRKAYGFRNIQNLIDMIMIVCSNLLNITKSIQRVFWQQSKTCLFILIKQVNIYLFLLLFALIENFYQIFFHSIH